MTFDEWWESEKSNLYQDSNSHVAARKAWAYGQLNHQPQEENYSTMSTDQVVGRLLTCVSELSKRARQLPQKDA